MSDVEQTTTAGRQWAIVCDGTEHGPEVKYLSESQEWGTFETAMCFATEREAVNGAETLCPPFTPGHAQEVTRAV